MRNFISDHDLKRLATGAAIASAAGVLMGATLKPNLDAHDVAGPQIQMGGGGPRKLIAEYDPGVGAYVRAIPEYVIGTDWTRPHDVPPQQAADAEYAADAGEYAGDVMAYEAQDTVPEVTRTAYVDEPRPSPRYPSVSGNVDYEANLPAPPAPPADLDGEPADAG